MRQWTTIDKTDWGEGPWQTEPDKVQWTDEATGLPCLVVRHPEHGHFCGYVGLPPTHRLHGKQPEDIDVPINVHDEISYANECQTEWPEGQGVCHIPEPGEPDDVWWFGFACMNFNDLSPGMEAGFRKIEELRPELAGKLTKLRDFGPDWMHKHYRPLPYVKSEVTKLAKQLR